MSIVGANADCLVEFRTFTSLWGKVENSEVTDLFSPCAMNSHTGATFTYYPTASINVYKMAFDFFRRRTG